MRAAICLLVLLVQQRAVADEVEYRGWLGRWWDVRATAYSPQDPIDQAYRDSKGPRWRNITADGLTDVRRVPYGIAVPSYFATGPMLRYGTRVVIPAGQGYLDQTRPDDRVFPVDDTGSAITERTESEGLVYVDLRFRTTRSAHEWAGPAGWRALRLFVVRCAAPPPALTPTLPPQQRPVAAPPMPRPTPPAPVIDDGPDELPWWGWAAGIVGIGAAIYILSRLVGWLVRPLIK